jgi:hypothetical protein
MQNFTYKKILFSVILAVALVVVLQMFGLLRNIPPVAY